MRIFRKGGIRPFVVDYLQSLGDLSGKVFIDLPAGDGAITRVIRETGATVEAYDLYPEYFQVEDMVCRPADLETILPIPDSHADYVLCQEGLEHLPNQLGALREFNRILKPGGKLVVTTPNGSNLRGRLARFFLDGYLFNKLPINELDAVRSYDDENDRFYFGHIFLMSAQQLRILGRVAGLKLVDVQTSRVSMGSVALGLLYPVFWLVNWMAARETLKRHKRVAKRDRQRVCRDVMRLNLHPKIMFCKKLFMVFEKEYALAEAAKGFFVKDAV